MYPSSKQRDNCFFALHWIVLNSFAEPITSSEEKIALSSSNKLHVQCVAAGHVRQILPQKLKGRH